jgi:hypothetical protein
MEGLRNAFNVLVGEPEGKRPLGRHRRRWEDDVRMDLRKMVVKCGLDSFGLG